MKSCCPLPMLGDLRAALLMVCCLVGVFAWAVPPRDASRLLPEPESRKNLGEQAAALARSYQTEGPRWFKELPEGLGVAARENRPALIYFFSPECGWCRRLDQETLQSPEIKAVLTNYVLVRINVLDDEQTPARFRVRGTPVLVVLSPEGRETQRLPGFMEVADLREALDAVLGPQGQRKSNQLPGLLTLLRGGQLPEDRWAEVLAAMADERERDSITGALAALDAAGRTNLVCQLQHSLLAVRLGALDALEELAGNAFGFDPWGGSGADHAEALQRWLAWAGNTNAALQRHLVLAPDEVDSYVRDLLADDRDRAARAKRMLQGGGMSALQGIEAYLTAHPDLPPGNLNRLREIRYSLLLPPLQGLDSATVAHRLVFGNLDLRTRTLRDVAAARKRALPVIRDFLTDPEPLVRESAVETLVKAGGLAAVPLLETHLEKETDGNVVFLVLKQLGALPSKKGLAILTKYLGHANEDLAVVALESVGRLRASTVSAEIGKSLADPRWRVRVAALKAVEMARIKDLAPQVTTLLQDPDAFVRSTAVESIAAIASKESAPALEKAFHQDDALKGPVIRALYRAELPIAESLVKALNGKEPSLLLGVLEQIERVDAAVMPLFRWLAAHENSDVACAALRVIAATGLENTPGQDILAERLKSGDRQRRLTIMRWTKMDEKTVVQYNPDSRTVNLEAATNSVRPPSGGGRDAALEAVFAAFERRKDEGARLADASSNLVEDVFQAFEGKSKKTAGENFFQTFLRVGRESLEAKQDPELQIAAAAFLLQLGDTRGIPLLIAQYAGLSREQRGFMAEGLARVRKPEAVPLIRLMLSDPMEEVRQAALMSLQEGGGSDATVRLLFAEMQRPGTLLKPWEVGQAQAMSYSSKGASKASVNREALHILKTSTNADRVTFALVALQNAWTDASEAAIEPFLQSRDPWQRRAAYHSLGKNRIESLAKYLPRLLADSSEHVRVVLPAVYAAAAGQSSWTDYYEADHPQQRFIYSYGGDRRTSKLSEEVRVALGKLANDPSDTVRFEAMFTLLLYREPMDLSGFVAVLEKLPRNSGLLERLTEYVQENFEILGPGFAMLLPYLDFEQRQARYGWTDAAQQNERQKKLEAIYAHFGAQQDEAAAPAPLLAGSTRRRVEATFLPRASGDGQAAQEHFHLAFFYKTGCEECDAVRRQFRFLREAFTNLVVHEFDINKSASVVLNEALASRFGVPEPLRLVAPTVFAGAGYLVKDNITPDRLAQLLVRGASLPVTAWLQTPQTELVQAHENIVRRYRTTGLGVVVVAGLLDGINPCAFATIIFLLSWLQVTRKPARDIAQVGAAYILGVFVAYFLLGLGLVKLSAALAQLRWASQALNYGMAAFALILVALNLRDGFYCLRGRPEQMTLQLPAFLKARIHRLIREGVRHPQLVLIAVFLGLAISFLELACTGQVYLPTITYMVQQGQRQALFDLLLYNLAFIAPLATIFVLAYGGLRSESILLFLRRRAALVKFSTAALFLLLFVVLMLGQRGGV